MALLLEILNEKDLLKVKKKLLVEEINNGDLEKLLFYFLSVDQAFCEYVVGEYRHKYFNTDDRHIENEVGVVHNNGDIHERTEFHVNDSNDVNHNGDAFDHGDVNRYDDVINNEDFNHNYNADNNDENHFVYEDGHIYARDYDEDIGNYDDDEYYDNDNDNYNDENYEDNDNDDFIPTFEFCKSILEEVGVDVTLKEFNDEDFGSDEELWEAIFASDKPIIDALYQTFEDLALIVLNRGLNIETRDENNHTPLMRACIFGKIKAATKLIELGSDVNAMSGDLIVFEFAVFGFGKSREYMGLQDENSNVLTCINLMQLLLDHGARWVLQDEGMPMLHNFMKILWDDFYDEEADDPPYPNEENSENIGSHFVIFKEFALRLMEAEVEVDPLNNTRGGRTPLMYAVCLGFTDWVDLFMEKGSDVNTQADYAKFTALKYAVIAKRDTTYILEKLLLSGANVDQHLPKSWNKGAYHHYPTVKTLVKFGMRTDRLEDGSFTKSLVKTYLYSRFGPSLVAEVRLLNLAYFSSGLSSNCLREIKDEFLFECLSDPVGREWLDTVCSKPMTLLALSRLAIFKYLRRKPNRIVNIKELVLPVPLEGYLQYDDIIND